MNKTYAIAVAAFLIVFMVFGMVVTSVSATGPVDGTDGLVVVDEEKPIENIGAMVVDVTDLVSDHTAGYLTTPRNQEIILSRINQTWATTNQRFPDDGSTIYAPTVILVADGKMIGERKEGESTFSLFGVNQAVPPSGDIDWDFMNSCGTSQSSPSILWDCNVEMPNIEFFVEGGGNGVAVSIEDCITDVFGTPFFTQTVIFRRNDGLPQGVYAQYTSSIETPIGSGNFVGYIDLPTGCSDDPDTIPNWYDAAGNDTGVPWQVTAREGRLDALTHEMIHAYYDRLNPYYHPWGEGMIEMQAILARKLWCQRNSYTPPNKSTLALGVPTTLPLYENLNQEGIQPSGGFFYDITGGNPRYPYLMNTRYDVSATTWWKVWRETSPAIISATNSATYGAGTYFVDWNSEYWDHYFANGDGGYPGIRGDVDLMNSFTTTVLDNEKGDTLVENQDYETVWYGAQHVLDVNTHTGGKLYVPFGPSTPAGGQMYTTGDDQSGICDFGTYYTGGPTNSIFYSNDNSPYFYQTIAGGSEIGLAGNLNLTVYSLHARGGLNPGDDITTRVSYHDAHTGAGWPTATTWTNVPASGATIMTFAATGRINSVEGGAFFPPALYFRDTSVPGGPLPRGGYQAVFQAEDTSATTTAEYSGLFANQEQYVGGQSGVIVGGGVNTADQIAFNINHGAFSALAGFGGDCAFEDNTYYDDVNGGILGYEFQGQNAPYPDYAYANAGPYYYVKQFVTSFNRLSNNIPPMIGRYGFAMIAQSTDYSYQPSRIYFNQFVSPDAQPAPTGLTHLVYRPDYIPSGSTLVKCYIYANSVGRRITGGYEHVPILVNGGRAGNPTSELCTGEFLGKDNEPRSNLENNCACGGWASTQSTFRFDITPYVTSCYDTITVTNLYQEFEPGSPQRYGYEVVMIYENQNLPLNQVMIMDGALRLCNNHRDNSNTVFTGFRTPPDPDQWVTDEANAGAYVGIIGNSADNGRGRFAGTFNTEWDFWACGSDMKSMDRFWLNPLPADPDGTGGAWWAPGWIGSTSDASNPPNRPPGFPDPYYWGPRAMNPTYASTGKQFSCAWFWNKNFTVVAAKTALMWQDDPWWTYVNADYDEDNSDGSFDGWNNYPHITETSAGSGIYSYLGGSDSTVTLRPYLVCGDNYSADLTDGNGPCVATEWGNNWPPNCNTSTAAERCRYSTMYGPWPTPYYPESEERGHLHAFVLQVPIVPSLSLEKTAYPTGTVLPDSVLTYTITITNDTPYTQENVTLVENYPQGVTFLDANPPPDLGENIWSTSISDDGNLDPHESFSVIIRVQVGHLPKGTRLLNTCYTSAETAPNPAYAQYENSCLGEPELTISKTSKKFLAVQGDKIKYRLKVQNVGDREAMNVVLTDMFPRELEYVSSVPAGSLGLNKITWAIGQLNPSQTYFVDLVLKLRDDIKINPGVSVINTAVATSSEGLKVQDQSVLIVYRRPDEPVTCPKPDIDVSYDGDKLCVTVDRFGGCSPYTLRITSLENDVDIIATIDRPAEEKCIDLSISTDDTIQIELQNKYAGSYFYCYKITPDSIDASEIPCP